MPELKFYDGLDIDIDLNKLKEEITIDDIDIQLNKLKKHINDVKNSLTTKDYSRKDRKALELKITHAENLYNSLNQKTRLSDLDEQNDEKIRLISLVYYADAVLVYGTDYDSHTKNYTTNETFSTDEPGYSLSPIQTLRQTPEEYKDNAKQLGLFALELEKLGHGRTDRAWLKTISTIALTLSVVALVAAGVIFTGGLGVIPVAGVAAYFGISAATLGWIGSGLAIGGGVGAGISSYGRFGYAPGRGEAGHASRLAQGGESTLDKKVKKDDTTDHDNNDDNSTSPR